VFWATAGDGLERLASPFTDVRPRACPWDALLSSGASIQCELAFVVPMSVTLDRLIYRDGTTDAEAPIPSVTPCSRCDGRCAELSSDPENCGVCSRAVPPNSTCADGEIECTDIEALVCEDVDGSSLCVVADSAERCGDCDTACDSLGGGGECRDGTCLYRVGGFFGDCNFICPQMGLTCASSEQCGAEGNCTTAQQDGCSLTCLCME
jgi:hypothetical protein